MTTDIFSAKLRHEKTETPSVFHEKTYTCQKCRVVRLVKIPKDLFINFCPTCGDKIA